MVGSVNKHAIATVGICFLIAVIEGIDIQAAGIAAAAQQLHIVYSQWCNVSRLYINFQLSIICYMVFGSRWIFLMSLRRHIPRRRQQRYL